MQEQKTQTVQNTTIQDTVNDNREPLNGISDFALPATVLAAVVISMVSYLKLKTPKSTKIVRHHFNSLEFDSTTGNINLFRRHQKDSNLTVKLEQLIRSELLFNSEIIITLDGKSANHFNNEVEQDIRNRFAVELRAKMQSKQTRLIQLNLHTAEAMYPVILYLREGNQRLTKSSYKNIIEQILNWHWFYAAKLSTTPLPERSVTQIEIPLPAALKKISITAPENNLNEAKNESIPEQSIKMKKPAVDINAVNALVKLADMEKSGQLSAEEFRVMKAKLMEDLLK